jgi:hypothetical protein
VFCNEVLGDEPHFKTGGMSGALPADHPLKKFWRVYAHWDCYEDWPERPRFARDCVAAEAASMPRNEHVGLAVHNERMCVGVSKHGFVEIWLAETGTCLFVPLSDWSAWLSDPTCSADDYHRSEISSLWNVLSELRQLFPTSRALLAAVDWDAKEQFLKAEEAERARRWRLRCDALEAHNEAIRRFFREHGVDGPRCPHCGHSSADIEFVDRAAFNSPSCFVCPACARSFGHDL